MNVVATELLEELAAEAKDEAAANGTPPPTANGNGSGGGGHRLDVQRWLNDRGLKHRLKARADAKGRSVYVLAKCPFDPSHKDPDACIMRDGAGKLSAKCLHNSCAGRGWKEFKAAIGPPDDDHFDPPRRRKMQGKKVHAPAPDGKAEDGRPQIVITPEMKLVNDKAVESLARVPDLYVHGDSLARVVHDGADTRHISRAAGAPRIVPATTATLREALSAAALWLKHSVQAEGHVQTLPPDWAAPAILGRGSWPGLPRLAGVVEAPCLRPDGTVLDRPGYDRATGLLYCPSADYPPVPKNPSKADGVRASDELLALVVDFPFEGEEHAAAWLAAASRCRRAPRFSARVRCSSSTRRRRAAARRCWPSWSASSTRGVRPPSRSCPTTTRRCARRSPPSCWRATASSCSTTPPARSAARRWTPP